MKRVLLLTGALLLVASSAMANMANVRFALDRKDKFSSTKAIPNLCDNPGTTTIEANYSPNFSNIPCDQYTLTGPVLAPSTVYLVVGQADGGLSAVSFGIDYDGRDPDGIPLTGDETGISPSLVTFSPCSDGLTFPNDGGFGDFPKPKGGMRITWTIPGSCSGDLIAGVYHTVVGSFYIYAYSADVLRVTPNNNLQIPPELAVADCGGTSTDMSEFVDRSLYPAILGRVQFGAGSQGYTPCGVVESKTTTWGKIKSQYRP